MHICPVEMAAIFSFFEQLPIIYLHVRWYMDKIFIGNNV